MKKAMLWLALSGPLLVSTAQAQALEPALTGPSATSEEVLMAATAAAADDGFAALTFPQWVQEFEQEFQPMGVAQGGTTFFPGSAAVKASPLDRDFGRYLVMAYEQAVFDMRANFVMQTYGRMTAQTIRTLYEDSSTNRDEFPELELENALSGDGSRLSQLLDKALTVAEKKLDTLLVEQGVSPAELQPLTVPQRKELYKNNLTKTITKRAVSSMQGLVPVQTRIFTERGPNGTAVIVGVIAVQSEKTQQFARDISRKQPTLVTGKPRNLADLLPSDNPGYLDEIGLRFTYDEQGRPMLLSYGRTSVAPDPSWSPSRAFQARQNAQSQAQSLAESGIIEFMNVNIQVEESNTLSTQEEEVLERMTQVSADGSKDIQDTRTQIAEAISIFLRSGRAMAQGDLRGTSVLKNWEQEDENGVMHVGTVVGWTYGQLENANAIDARNRNQGGSGQPGAAAANRAIPDQSRTSRRINDKSDF